MSSKSLYKGPNTTDWPRRAVVRATRRHDTVTVRLACGHKLDRKIRPRRAAPLLLPCGQCYGEARTKAAAVAEQAKRRPRRRATMSDADKRAALRAYQDFTGGAL